MRRALLFLATAVLCCLGASAATCPLSMSASVPSSCVVSSPDGLFSWNLTDVQLSFPNPNVSPNAGAVNLIATASQDSSGERLQVTEQVDPSQWSALSGTGSLFFALNYNLSVVATGSSPAPSTLNETQEYLNGILCETVVNGQVTVGPQPLSTLDTNTNLNIQDLVVLTLQSSSPTAFTNAFQLQAPGSQGGTGTPPTMAPEPNGEVVLGIVGISLALLASSRKVTP